MIKIRLFTDYKTKDIIFKVRGHSGSAPNGEDLICAAASGFAMQTVETARGLYKQGWLIKKPRIAVEDGRVTVIIRPKAVYVSAVNLLMGMAATGFDWLQREYPDHVKLN